MGDSILAPIIGIAFLLLAARARYRSHFILMFLFMVISDTAFIMMCGHLFMEGIIPSSGSLLLMEALVMAGGFLIPKWLESYWVSKEKAREDRRRAEQATRQQRVEQERERRIAACREEMDDLRSIHGLDLTPFLTILQLDSPAAPAYDAFVQGYRAFRRSLDARVQAVNQEAQELGLNIRV